MRVGVLGPRGTYSEIAAKKQFSEKARIVPYPKITDVVNAVARKKIDCGVIPVESLREGSVGEALDAIFWTDDVRVQAEIVLPISYSILGLKRTKLENVTRVLSHPQALAQCKDFLRENLPEADLIEVSSTAKAVEIIGDIAKITEIIKDAAKAAEIISDAAKSVKIVSREAKKMAAYGKVSREIIIEEASELADYATETVKKINKIAKVMKRIKDISKTSEMADYASATLRVINAMAKLVKRVNDAAREIRGYSEIAKKIETKKTLEISKYASNASSLISYAAGETKGIKNSEKVMMILSEAAEALEKINAATRKLEKVSRVDKSLRISNYASRASRLIFYAIREMRRIKKTERKVRYRILIDTAKMLGKIKNAAREIRSYNTAARRLGIKKAMEIDSYASRAMEINYLVKSAPHDFPFMAAIGHKALASPYGLEVLHEDIQAGEMNITRFLCLANEYSKPTGHDKTSIAFYTAEDRPGILYEILQEFAVRNINLTKIESRPSKKALGDYLFFIDFEGHCEDPKVNETLKAMKLKTAMLKVLGSYSKQF